MVNDRSRTLITTVFLILLGCWASCSPAHADPRDWSTQDQVLGLLAFTAVTADHVTTLYGIRHQVPDTHETNLLLPRHPTVAQLGLHYVAGVGLMYTVSDRLPELRPLLLGGVLGMELVITAHNVSLGWRLQF